MADWFNSQIVFAGHWEPLIFRRRRGGQRVDEAQLYAREHSDEAIAAMKAVGINLVVTHFDKGFGLEHIKEELPIIKDWTARLHQQGIRVAAYIRFDNLMTETFAGSENWLSKTSFNQPSAILYASYRKSACPTHEDHHAYIESLMETAVKEAGVDMIHMDGFWVGSEAWACHCDRCVASFRKTVRERYPNKAAAIERFGHNDIEQLLPPTYNTPDTSLGTMEPLRDPVAQEWMWWRTARTETLAKRFATFLMNFSPEIVFELNSNLPIGYNNALYWGFEVSEQAHWARALWTEDDHWAGWREDGTLISRLREFKIGRTLGVKVFSYQRGVDEDSLLLSLLQSAAFNQGDIGMLGSPLLGEEPLYETKKNFMAWYTAHQSRFSGNTSAAEIAVWRSKRSLACNSTSAHRGVILMEQTLIQNKVAFDIIYDDDLRDLSRYKVLIAANAEMVDEEQMALISAFVKAGGGLLGTELVSLYDEWRRLRPDIGLRDLFGKNVLLDLGDNWQKPSIKTKFNASFTQNPFGSGRAAYIPSLETKRKADYTGVTGEEPFRFSTEQWENPKNAIEIMNGLKWVSGGSLSVEVDGPEGLAIDLVRQPNGEYLLHVLNYKTTATTQECKVKMRLPIGMVIKDSKVLAFGEESETQIRYSQSGITFKTSLPKFKRYIMLILDVEQ